MASASNVTGATLTDYSDTGGCFVESNGSVRFLVYRVTVGAADATVKITHDSDSLRKRTVQVWLVASAGTMTGIDASDLTVDDNSVSFSGTANAVYHVVIMY